MPSWYDHIPVAGSIARLAQGDFKQAGIDLIPGAPAVQEGYNAYTNAIDQQRQGLQDAAAQSRAEAERRRAFQMEGLNRAQGFFYPAQQMVGAAYGSPDKLRK